MGVLLGVIVTVLSLLAWGGQAISWVAPAQAVRWSLTEDEDSVEPVFHADIRGEAAWDTFTLWTMLVAGVLLLADIGAWAYFGLVGGGMYVYFAGRGIITRLVMRRRGYRIGTSSSVTVGLTFLLIWGVVGAITIGAAVVALSPA